MVITSPTVGEVKVEDSPRDACTAPCTAPAREMKGACIPCAVSMLLLVGGAAAQDSPKDTACVGAYTKTYMGCYVGNCAGRIFNVSCTPECQADLDGIKSKCAHSRFNDTDTDTGIISTRSFIEQSLQALQILGPKDCDYSAGFRTCDSKCSIAAITGGEGKSQWELDKCITVDPDSGQSGPEPVWHSCDAKCTKMFSTLDSNCNGCTDPELKTFLADAGAGMVRCEFGNGEACNLLDSVLNQACCAGEDHKIGTNDDTCNLANSTMPENCDNAICAAATISAARECPLAFIQVRFYRQL
jgi:hypothetical protein